MLLKVKFLRCCIIIFFLCVIQLYPIQPFIVHAQDPTGIADRADIAQSAAVANEPPFVYVSPRPNAKFVSSSTTIALRPGMPLDQSTLLPTLFTVEGTSSGRHQGEVRLADDGRTLIFVPTVAFTPAEIVRVMLAEGIRGTRGGAIPAFTFSFTISSNPTTTPSLSSGPSSLDSSSLDSATPSSLNGVPAGRSIHHESQTLLSNAWQANAWQANAWVPVDWPTSTDTGAETGTDALTNERAESTVESSATGQQATWPYYTLPVDLPLITVTVSADPVAGKVAAGELFLSTFILASGGKPSYMMIVGNDGVPIFYQKHAGTDFKKQPNGLLTYYSAADQAFHALDSSYQIVGTYQAGNGYRIDFHEFLLLPNGHALFMIYDTQKVNMDHIVPDGVHAARVTGLILQEIDTEGNVFFEWRSWDHIPIIDTIVPITTTTIDYIHGNALEVDHDGHLLLSSRHLNEITKINRETGEIIWQFGGKKNQFTFINDPDAPFTLQHDIRRLPNGNLTLFDNRNGPPSRGVEYFLDEVNKTATLVWSYSSAPDAYAFIVGNVQRLANGNSLIGWGSAWPTVTEVNAKNEKVFEMTLEIPQMSYRIHRYPWQGWPTWPAALVITEEERAVLHYSWNGATDVFYYRIYGGNTPTSLEIIDLQFRTGFEESTDITALLDRYCYFQVMPIGKDGRDGVASNLVYAEETCDQIYLPNIIHN